MTRYTVVYRADTEADLASLWCNAEQRDVVSAAADRIDRELSSNAQTKGIEVREGLRSLTVSPLIAYYFVEEDDRLVTIVALWKIDEQQE